MNKTTHTPRPGYKRTPLGWIPEEWEVVPLKKLIHINPSKRKLDSNTKVSFLGMADVSEDGKVTGGEERTFADVENGFTFFADEDILVAKITPCFENGKGALVTTLINGIGFGSTEFHVLRAKEKIDNKYLYYHTRTQAFRGRGEQNMTGSAGQKRVPKNFIETYPIPLPPLPEQRRIAAILSTWDRAIELTQQLIAAKTQQKRALMQRLLTGRVRVPGFSGPWQEVKLGEVCKTYSGGTPSRKKVEYFKGTIPWIKSGELNQKCVTSVEEKISLEAIENSSAKYVDKGTILIALYGATAGVVAITDIKATINQAILAVIPNKEIKKDFLFFLLDFIVPIEVNRLAQGGQPNLNANMIKNLTISFPYLPEQTAIARILTTADAEITLLERWLAALQAQKRGLMQVLLTGKIRVKMEEKSS